jgi:hypothetical protein
LSCVYPLRLFSADNEYAARTVQILIERYVDGKGFFHPVIHSGYNVYLTLQLAHACLVQGQPEKAWSVAETVLRNARPPYSFPEAIHPVTGGGTMGDGHHGWAAAEYLLFLRSCLLDESGSDVHLLRGITERVLRPGETLSFTNAPTIFGTISFEIRPEPGGRSMVSLKTKFPGDRRPRFIVLHVPWSVGRAIRLGNGEVRSVTRAGNTSRIECSSDVTTLVLEGRADGRS